MVYKTAAIPGAALFLRKQSKAAPFCIKMWEKLTKS